MMIDLGPLIPDKGYYGELTLTFNDSLIVLAKKIETFKPQLLEIKKDIDFQAVVVVR